MLKSPPPQWEAIIVSPTYEYRHLSFINYTNRNMIENIKIFFIWMIAHITPIFSDFYQVLYWAFKIAKTLLFQLIYDFYHLRLNACLVISLQMFLMKYVTSFMGLYTNSKWLKNSFSMLMGLLNVLERVGKRDQAEFGYGRERGGACNHFHEKYCILLQEDL